jgi:Flp pilus assembly protein TadG
MTSSVSTGEAIPMRRRLRERLSALHSECSGAAAVEVAIATPFLVLLTAGVIEYGSMLRATELMQTGVRDAARYLANMPGLPQASSADRSSIEDRARRLAVTGTIASNGAPRVKDWATSGVQVTYEPIANPRDATTGLRAHRGDNTIYVVRVTGTMNYTGVGLLQALRVGPVIVSAAHEERHVAL